MSCRFQLMMSLSFILSLCIVWSSFSLPVAARAGGSDGDAGSDCIQGFPESFYVSTGTTIPLTEVDSPVAQSGSLFVNGELGQVRMDQFYLGRQHTFIADKQRHRAYIFESHVPDAKDRNANCLVFATVGDPTTLCIPLSFTHDTDHLRTVRGVSVQRYHGFDRHGGPLLQIDHFVVNMTLSVPTGVLPKRYLVPWRMQTRQRPASELRGIAGAPLSTPNWRFFGQPMFDEVDFPLYSDCSVGDKDVATWSAESNPVTVDFYNFVPTPPDPSVFTIPDECRRAEQTWEDAKSYSSWTATARDDPLTRDNHYYADSLHHLTVAHRLLIDWSVSSARQGTRSAGLDR